MSGRYEGAVVIDGKVVIGEPEQYRMRGPFPRLTHGLEAGDTIPIWLNPDAVIWVKRADLAPILFPDE